MGDFKSYTNPKVPVIRVRGKRKTRMFGSKEIPPQEFKPKCVWISSGLFSVGLSAMGYINKSKKLTCF